MLSASVAVLVSEAAEIVAGQVSDLDLEQLLEVLLCRPVVLWMLLHRFLPGVPLFLPAFPQSVS